MGREQETTVVSLTRKQAAALDVFRTYDACTEELIADVCWPVVRRPSRTMTALLRKGLVERTQWRAFGLGYEYDLTDAGRSALSPESNPEGQ